MSGALTLTKATAERMSRRFLTGAEAVKAVRKLSTSQDARDQWPYPWLFPPPGSIRVRASASIAAPVSGTQAQVLLYTVPSGFNFVLTRVVQLYTGASFVPGSGDIVWSLDKNVAVGSPLVLGNPIQGFASEVVPLGSSEFPWTLDMPEILVANDQLRSKVLTTVNIPAGAPNYFTSMVMGWLAPAE